MFYSRNGEKMRILIVCIIYAILVTVLSSITVKNFFTELIFLIILFISFIAILLKLKKDIFIGDGSGSDIFIGYSDKTGYGLIGFIILMILGIAAIILFDRFFLKRRSKTEQEYRRRRKLAIAVAIILIGIIAVLRLTW